MDYLSDFPGTGFALPGGMETRFLSGDAGIQPLIAASPAQARAFDFDACLDSFRGNGGSGFASKRNAATCRRYGPAYERQLEELIGQLKDRITADPADLHPAIRDFIHALHAYICQQSKTSISLCIVNNDPPAAAYPLRRLAEVMQGTPIIFVDRCPKDAFVDFAIGKGSDVRDIGQARKFLSRYNRGLRGILQDGGIAENIHYIRFEDFVSVEANRTALSDMLGLDRIDPAKAVYSAERSRGNIGKWREHADSPAMAYI